MTFYWWSHWFWITLILSVNLLSSHVHTYPSQEAESLTSSPHTQSQTQPVRTTKLYQTTVTQMWGPATQSNIMDLTHRPTTTRPVVTPSYGGGPQLAQVHDVEQAVELQEEDEVVEEEELPLNDRDQQEQDEIPDQERRQDEADADPDADADIEDAVANEELAQFEFKRSADFTSDQLNNFTNFSSSTSTNGSSSSSTTTKPVAISSSSPASTTTTTAKVLATSPAAAITPRAGGSASTSTPAGSAATPSTPKIHTEWLSDELLAGATGGLGSAVTVEGEKAPFTLENANKEDELRRAESEHRSRKSKVLSAEYKHINRYINFSGDTKSLLTRSASAAPSVAGGVAGSGFYDGGVGDEGNISSEALAIQRTYFLDAGAISAICFTVFGVCCTVGTIGIVLYRRRYLNKPQALSEPDSSVYIDDSTMRFSLLILQDNSDEMYSLDNDSFLNSLEAMTIQNYWTDTVKHTKL
uniref:Uncharacterized protein, isoform E n=1 Tax=Drosophila melanogaster TaxID=7227 RepID=M9PJQ1_DROME|nr:uncharacterized protein Dmel_CG12991, isoform E [Drosophila melanogaster]AGB95491.1 uncharacterized protein Dmel_CG12991, isoform E [Drosophila melanogaster]|eukprot:NP_001259649.1 uncharacterized protein Dmel_CG12991, isoform E [Drosophila melanogaster]